MLLPSTLSARIGPDARTTLIEPPPRPPPPHSQMIACGPFSRIDRLWRAARAPSNPPLHSQVVKSPKYDYSHFISLPLAIYPKLAEKLQNFQNNVLGSTSGFDGNPELADSSDLGIEKSIFIKPNTFHLTVLMLKLWNKDLVARAAEVLQKISSKVNDALDNRPVSVKLKGLECMRGSPAEARVLYAPVKEIGAEGRLLRACQVIIEAYVEAGLVLEKDALQTLKLHATIMNARYRKWKKGCKRRDSFDARQILRRYRSSEWGDYVIREAHLSQRFSYDEGGYYHCCASIPFPKALILNASKD